MSKKITFFLWLMIVPIVGVFSQACTPDITCDTLICPMQLAPAIATKSYDQTITMYVPDTTKEPVYLPQYNINLPAGIPVDSIGITKITGVPTGMNYYIYNNKTSFPGNSYFCVNIYGTPTTAAVGPHQLVISAYLVQTLNGMTFNNPFTIPLLFDVYDSTYVIPVDTSSNAAIGEYGKATLSFSVQPNPVVGNAQLTFESLYQEIVFLEVLNGVGEAVLQRQIPAQLGLNTYLLDQSFGAGVYMLRLSSKHGQFTQKLIILEK